MPTLSQLVPRKPGDRCCARDARPALSAMQAEQLTADLEVLAHPVRLQILSLLARHEGRVCVCDLEAAVPVKQPTVSHHLRVLRDTGLVGVERRGLWAYYYVLPDALEELERWLS
jgi:ArsR family transcriptional regulator